MGWNLPQNHRGGENIRNHLNSCHHPDIQNPPKKHNPPTHLAIKLQVTNPWRVRLRPPFRKDVLVEPWLSAGSLSIGIRLKKKNDMIEIHTPQRRFLWYQKKICISNYSEKSLVFLVYELGFVPWSPLTHVWGSDFCTWQRIFVKKDEFLRKVPKFPTPMDLSWYPPWN